MANEPLRRTPPRPAPVPPGRPKIWAEGSQRPRFDLRAFARASLHLSREGAAPLLAWAARTARRVAVNVKNGAGRIPEGKLGRFARFVPSHLRVAHWIKTFGAILAHASANADPEVKRGNALVAEIEPHLWPQADAAPTEDQPSEAPAPEAPAPETPPAEPEPVVLTEPVAEPEDPLAAIRTDLDGHPAPRHRARAGQTAPEGPAQPPAPPGQVGAMTIQMTGYVLGWGTAILALPYGLGRALWLHIKGIDLRGIGAAD